MKNHHDLPHDYVAETSRKARASALWLGSTNLLWQGISWALTILTARILNPTDYGLVALIETVTPYLALIASLNLPIWLIQTKELSEREERVIFTIVLAIGAFISIVAFLLAPTIANFYESPDLESPLRLVSCSFFLQSLYLVPDALLQRELKFKPIAIRRLFTGIFRSILQLTLALLGFGYWALVIGIVLKELAYAIWMISYRGLPRGLAFDREIAMRAFRYGLPATASAISWVVFSTSDKVIVGKLFGLEILGFYSLAFLLIDLPLSKINSILRPVLIPYFSRLQGHIEELREIFLRVVRGLACVSFPMLIGLAVVSKEAVAVVLGAKWLPMVPSLSILCLIGLLRAIGDNIPPLLLALGQPKKEFVFNFVSLLTMPLAFYAFGQLWGFNGIFVAWFVVYPLILYLILRALTQALQISLRRYLFNLHAPIIASLSLAVVTYFCGVASSGVTDSVKLMIMIGAGVVTYGAMLATLLRSQIVDLLPAKK